MKKSIKQVTLTRIKCGDCVNFRPDKINPREGVGECLGHNAYLTYRQYPPRPFGERICPEFIKKHE